MSAFHCSFASNDYILLSESREEVETELESDYVGLSTALMIQIIAYCSLRAAKRQN